MGVFKDVESYLRQNSWHFEDFSREVGQVGHSEYEKGLQNPGVAGEPGDKTCNESPNNSDEGPSQGHDEERGEPFSDVKCTQVLLTNLRVGLKHAVKDLWKKTSNVNYCVINFV